MEKYLKNLIAEEENQKLDFKYCISDSRKIARSLVAFSNTDGGRLLIGVRDNGSIAGIRTDEEYYMVETAVELFCKPEIKFTTKQHNLAGKTILEIEVARGDERPYKAKDEDERWVPYFRNNDQNLVANSILVQVWKKVEMGTGVLVKFGKAETLLMEYLEKKGSITFSGFRKIAHIPPNRAEKILVNLLIFKVLKMKVSERGFAYELEEPEKDKVDRMMPDNHFK